MASTQASIPAIASWREPAAIALLAANCAARPEPESPGDPGPLACDLGFEQSCVYDPCFTKAADCRAVCGKTCVSCDAACVTSCSACKAKCTDEACRRACAEPASVCRESCIKTRDKCATAGCANVESSCNVVNAKKWKANGCTGKCPQVEAARQACLEHPKPGCNEALSAKFPGCDIMYCIMGLPPEPEPK